MSSEERRKRIEAFNRRRRGINRLMALDAEEFEGYLDTYLDQGGEAASRLLLARGL